MYLIYFVQEKKVMVPLHQRKLTFQDYARTPSPSASQCCVGNWCLLLGDFFSVRFGFFFFQLCFFMQNCLRIQDFFICKLLIVCVSVVRCAYWGYFSVYAVCKGFVFFEVNTNKKDDQNNRVQEKLKGCSTGLPVPCVG